MRAKEDKEDKEDKVRDSIDAFNIQHNKFNQVLNNIDYTMEKIQNYTHQLRLTSDQPRKAFLTSDK